MRRVTLNALCVPLCLMVAGCSEQQEYVTVVGTVYYNDNPLTAGVVMFQPPAGDMARGTIQADGTYELETLGKSEGVEPGLCKVRVSVREKARQNAGEVGLGRLLIPERYTDFDRSGLTFEVTASAKRKYDIHLTNSN